MKCFNMVKDETDVVFDFIEKVTDPSIICHGMQVQRKQINQLAISNFQLCSASSPDDLAKAITLGLENLPKATVQIKGIIFME